MLCIAIILKNLLTSITAYAQQLETLIAEKIEVLSKLGGKTCFSFIFKQSLLNIKVKNCFLKGDDYICLKNSTLELKK